MCYKAICVGIVGAISITGVSVALSAETSNLSTSALMEEIVVTSRKRAIAESVQDIPLAITAFSEEQFKAVYAFDFRDVGNLAPNVVFQETSHASVANFNIRGVGVQGSVFSDSPAVGLFQNGVYLGVNYGASLDVFDIESLEILRGPQGTLFGRNVTGGAVRVITKRPGDTFGFSAETVQGNYDRQDYSFAVEGPLKEGVLNGRFVLLDRRSDGLYDNLFSNGEDYGGRENTLLRGTLQFNPTENFDATLILEDIEEEGDNRPVRSDETPGTWVYGQGFREPSNFWDVYADLPGETEVDVVSATLEANWRLDHGLISSITGYRDVESYLLNDQDGTQFSGFHHAIDYEQDQFSQELRYASNFSESYNFTLGLYYFEQEFSSQESRNLVDGAIVVASGNSQDQDSWAVFGELEFNLTDDLSLLLGGRYTEETIEVRTVSFGTCALDESIADPNERIVQIPVPCDLGPSESEDYSDFSPKIGLNWRLSDEQLVYASATRGFRSGGFTLRGSAITPPFDPESVDAYEVGYKGDLLNGRLRINAVAFINEYEDLQRTLVFDSPTQGSLQTTQNAAGATIMGLEAEMLWEVVDNLILGINWGYLDKEYDEFDGLDVNGDGTPDPDLAKDLDFVRAPDNTLNVSVNYDLDMADKGSVNFRVSGRYMDSVWFNDTNTREEPSYTVWDASITWQDASQNWSVGIFGKNLFEEEYNHWGADISLMHLRYSGDPRTAGVRLSYNY